MAPADTGAIVRFVAVKKGRSIRVSAGFSYYWSSIAA
jgi:hypothetical protein